MGRRKLEIGHAYLREKEILMIHTIGENLVMVRNLSKGKYEKVEKKEFRNFEWCGKTTDRRIKERQNA